MQKNLQIILLSVFKKYTISLAMQQKILEVKSFNFVIGLWCWLFVKMIGSIHFAKCLNYFLKQGKWNCYYIEIFPKNFHNKKSTIFCQTMEKKSIKTPNFMFGLRPKEILVVFLTILSLQCFHR